MNDFLLICFILRPNIRPSSYLHLANHIANKSLNLMNRTGIRFVDEIYRPRIHRIEYRLTNGAYDDNRHRILWHESTNKLYAIHTGHLYVTGHHVRLEPLDLVFSIEGFNCSPHHFNAWI